jgi:hypothetical protein
MLFPGGVGPLHEDLKTAEVNPIEMQVRSIM